MIIVTKLSDKEVYLNSDFIEQIESTPDTTITLTNGKKIIVKNSIDDLVERIIEYKKKIKY